MVNTPSNVGLIQQATIIAETSLKLVLESIQSVKEKDKEPPRLEHLLYIFFYMPKNFIFCFYHIFVW